MEMKGSKLNILLLAGNTVRARAYAQYLAHWSRNDINIHGLFCGFDQRKCIPSVLNHETKSYFERENLFIPNLHEPLKITFKQNNWYYKEVEDTNVNSDEVFDEIQSFDCDLVVFAGYGGQILKGHHFNAGRRYLHMHPGALPLERGSTTIYYSILNNRKCTVTAFYMTRKIDDGENVYFVEYPVPDKGVDIDQWFDCVIRADCFIKALSIILEGKQVLKPSKKDSEVYYVIHPVLKHIALLSLK